MSLESKGRSPKKVGDCYYKYACTTTSMAEVMQRIRKVQRETFSVRVRFGFVDANGNRMCESGVITGVLDNGDEVYIDAETIEYMEATKKYLAEQEKEKAELKEGK